MEAEHGSISKLSHSRSVQLLTKGMGRIVNHLQAMLLGNLMNPVHITNISIHMNRHNGAGFLRNQIFNLLCIHSIIPIVNITEYGSQAVPDNGMGCRCKGKRGCNHLTLQIHGLQSQLQSHMAIDKQLQIRCLQKTLQLPLQLLVILAHIGQPCAFPDRL